MPQNPQDKQLDQMQLAQLLSGNAQSSRSNLKTLTSKLIDSPPYDFFEFSNRSDPREREYKIALIMDIIQNGTQNMSARHVAESVFDIVDRPMKYQDMVALQRIAARHTQQAYPYKVPTPPEHELEEHTAECCVHHCRFNDFECPVTNGTATADMICEDNHED